MINLKFSNKKEPFYNVKLNEYGTILYLNKNGELHNLKGLAVEYIDGSKEYWINGKLHRLDGPAIDYTDNYKDYWINGQRLTKEEFDKLTKHSD